MTESSVIEVISVTEFRERAWWRLEVGLELNLGE